MTLFMRRTPESRRRRPSVVWLYAVALLVLPGCDLVFPLNAPPGAPVPNLNQGDLPRSGLIFCDIEKPLGRHCASEAEKTVGTRLAAAATSLTSGQSGVAIGLDDSPAALAHCGGEPEAITFQCPFPGGCEVCLNCGGVLGPIYPDANAACAARCEDFFGPVDDQGALIPDNPPGTGVASFCQQNARTSTNVTTCIDGACTPGGNRRDDFVDPRRFPEGVLWQDPPLIGVTATYSVDAFGVTHSSLTRTAPIVDPTNPQFDAGAASIQWIARGDGYVEFAASEQNLSHVAGLSSVPVGCTAAANCPITDAGLNGLGFAISLNKDGRVFVIEGGALVGGPDLNGSFGTYAAGERFRVSAKDNVDGTATISYARIVGPCFGGMPCTANVFLTHPAGASPHYPLRVQASFREQNAVLSDVKLVRIQ